MIAIVAALALVTTAAGAYGEKATKLNLMGSKDAPNASGKMEIKGDELKISAKGLKANSIYTVWFVNMKPTMSKEGAGKEPFSFTTNDKGEGKYEAKLGVSPVGKWQMLMIVRHPDGNPKNMDKVEDALQAEIKG